MNIVFRVDSSIEIGSGHLMRCLTLANRLEKEKQAKVAFISRNLKGNLNYLIEENGYDLFVLPQYELNSQLTSYQRWLTVETSVDVQETKCILQNLNVDCLIVDSYALDEAWEKPQRLYVKKIMVIDDLANRRHDCDILLDQNYYQDIETRYNGLVPKQCKLLLGPKYALLRDEFYEERKHLRVRDGSIQRILVFFGGSDQTNETMKAIRALVSMSRPDIRVDVVVGASNKKKEDVERFCCQHKNMKYYCQVGNMAELMHKADLAIGAGGSTIWERCFLGLPAIVIAIAENQFSTCEDCGTLGLFEYMGKYTEVSISSLAQKVHDMMTDDVTLLRMQKSCNQLYEEEFIWKIII